MIGLIEERMGGDGPANEMTQAIIFERQIVSDDGRPGTIERAGSDAPRAETGAADPREQRLCLQCSTQFAPRTPKQRFCKPACSKAWHIRHNARPWEVGGNAYRPSDFKRMLKLGEFPTGTICRNQSKGEFVASSDGYKFHLAPVGDDAGEQAQESDAGGYAPVTVNQVLG
jgi:hypothetical protein